MPTIKVYPPSQLPDRGVSETQFSIWVEELEVYLSQEEQFRLFLKGEAYGTWQSQEVNPDRLTAVNGPDAAPVQADRTKDEANLRMRQRQLRTVLSIIGKCVSQGHYDAVIRHSTSMQSIFNMLRGDYDIQKKGIQFFNLLDVKYDPLKMTPIAFYNQYRTMISTNLSRKSDVIKYKDNIVLEKDEAMTPMLEDLILLDVIREIDIRLPGFIRLHYTHKMSTSDKLMDFKNDIMNNIPNFLLQLEKEENFSSIKAAEPSPTLAAFRNFTPRNQTRGPGRNQSSGGRGNMSNSVKGQTWSALYCRLCHKCNMPRNIYTGHNLGDSQCTQLSFQDRQRLSQPSKLSNLAASEESEDQMLARTFGYDLELEAAENYEELLQVKTDSYKPIAEPDSDISRLNKEAKLGYIKPEPTQILTVFKHQGNKTPVFIDLDSGASLNYILESEVHKHNFTMYPNGQLSKLGDGLTKLAAIGEIDVTFFRNDWTVRFRGVVVKHLQSPIIGGTVFMKDNEIEQNLSKKTISVHGGQHTVQETNPLSILPIEPIVQNETLEIVAKIPVAKGITVGQIPVAIPVAQEETLKTNTLARFKSIKVVLPGQNLHQSVDISDDTVVTVEPWAQNKLANWPDPQLCTVKNKSIEILNKSPNPIILGKDVINIKIRPAVENLNKQRMG